HLIGVHSSYLVPGLEICRRVRARGPSDRFLIQENHTPQLIRAKELIEPPPVRVRRPLKETVDRMIERLVHERALSRAAHARNDHESLQRKLRRDVLEI